MKIGRIVSIGLIIVVTVGSLVGAVYSLHLKRKTVNDFAQKVANRTIVKKVTEMKCDVYVKSGEDFMKDIDIDGVFFDEFKFGYPKNGMLICFRPCRFCEALSLGLLLLAIFVGVAGSLWLLLSDDPYFRK